MLIAGIVVVVIMVAASIGVSVLFWGIGALYDAGSNASRAKARRGQRADITAAWGRR